MNRLGVPHAQERILTGEMPADLPVQTPTQYGTCNQPHNDKSLGLTMRPPLLAPAYGVIEKLLPGTTTGEGVP